MTFHAPPPLPEWIEKHLPFQRRIYEIQEGPDAGRHIHFIDHGSKEGRPVFFQHGNPMWSFLWRKVIAALDPEQYRCIAPDLLGTGLSTPLPTVEDHQLSRHTQALSECFEALELEDVILVGQDWGGPMITNIGANFSERITGVVLGNTSVLAPRNPRGTLFHKLANIPLFSKLLFQHLEFSLRMLHRVQGDRASIRGEIARCYKWPFRQSKNKSALLGLTKMVPNHQEHPSMEYLKKGEDWLKAFDGPMAIVWGMKDPILGHVLKRHAQTFSNAEVTTTQAGHFLQEEVDKQITLAIESVALQSSEAFS